MRVMVHTDLEGVAGVFAIAQCGGGGVPPEPWARRALSAEVNACVEGIFDEEPAAELDVRDGHGAAGFDAETLTNKPALVSGKNSPNLGEGFAALFFVGQHSMANTPGANLPHSYSHEVEHYKLNGQPVGEFHMHVYRAGTVHGVPAAFLSGDEAAVAEARSLVPEIVGVAVKKALGPEEAEPLPDEEARGLIRRGAAEAVRRVRAGRVKPVRIEPPYVLEVRALPGQEALVEDFLSRGAERVDARTVVIRSDEPKAIMRGRASVAL